MVNHRPQTDPHLVQSELLFPQPLTPEQCRRAALAAVGFAGDDRECLAELLDMLGLLEGMPDDL